jgi:Leucine-rich repeat (LRR) protein
MFKKVLSSDKKQKEINSFQEKLESSTFSLTPKLLDRQRMEVQTELLLSQNYPPEQRSKIDFLEISEKGLLGLLDLTDFISLEELYCYDNQLTRIEFADSIFDKLRVLHVGNNNFFSQDLSLFSHFTKLEVLNLENNNFIGSLKVLKNLVNLRSLDISNTNIDSGLIYLSDQLESLFCRVEKEVRCQKISEELKEYDLGHDCYDFQA